MLKRLIRSIRQKPKVVRDQYAFVIAVSFTAVVALVWFTSMTSTFAPLASDSEASLPEAAGEERESLGDVVSGLREEFESLTEQSSITTTPEVTTTTASTTASTSLSVSTTVTPAVIGSATPEVRIATFTASSTE